MVREIVKEMKFEFYPQIYCDGEFLTGLQNLKEAHENNNIFSLVLNYFKIVKN